MLSSVSRTVLRVPVATRGFASVDWSALTANLSSDSAKASVNKYRQLIAQIDNAAETYSSSPPPIDFAGYKGKIRSVVDVKGKPVSVVDVLEEVGKSFVPGSGSTAGKADLEAALKSAEATASSSSGSAAAAAKVTAEVLKSAIANFDDAAHAAAAKADADSASSLTTAAAEAKKTATTSAAETTKRIAELEAQVTRMKSKRVDRTTTVEDVYEAYPDIKEEVHGEIDKHEWHKDIA